MLSQQAKKCEERGSVAISKGARQVEGWLSAGEAGRKLGTSGTWVTRLARDGKIEGVHTSLGWLIEPKSVEKEARRRSQQKKLASKRRSAQPELIK
jgi:hypothetical protein